MKNKTNLQSILISRIDDFCGIEQINKKLNFFKLGLPVRDRIMVDSIIQYCNNLYLMPINCEDDFVIYRTASFKALEFLEIQIKKTNCKYLSLVHGNISIGINYVKDVRILA
jgi:hypothetical protein